MRTVIQRVTHACVRVLDEGYEAAIGKGLLVLAAFIDEDTDEDLEWTARKIAAMRIFDDAEGVMNLSVKDVDGEILAVSQFTLYASTVKGNRPSYIKAAKPDIEKDFEDYELGLQSLDFVEKIEVVESYLPASQIITAQSKRQRSLRTYRFIISPAESYARRGKFRPFLS